MGRALKPINKKGRICKLKSCHQRLLSYRTDWKQMTGIYEEIALPKKTKAYLTKPVIVHYTKSQVPICAPMESRL